MKKVEKKKDVEWIKNDFRHYMERHLSNGVKWKISRMDDRDGIMNELLSLVSNWAAYQMGIEENKEELKQKKSKFLDALDEIG